MSKLYVDFAEVEFDLLLTAFLTHGLFFLFTVRVQILIRYPKTPFGGRPWYLDLSGQETFQDIHETAASFQCSQPVKPLSKFVYLICFCLEKDCFFCEWHYACTTTES